MKKSRLLGAVCALCVVTYQPANAASTYYRFVGDNLNSEIDFTLEVDFAREGFIVNSADDSTFFDPDPVRDTFFSD